MAPLPAPAEKPSHRVSDSQSHAKVRPPTQVAVFCAALWPNLQPALTERTIRREASPSWLGQQRLDIYLPELALSIEHQGEQHFFPIDAFGGESALEKTRERDQRKRALCKQNGVTVIDVRFDDPITMPSLTNRLQRWLR